MPNEIVLAECDWIYVHRPELPMPQPLLDLISSAEQFNSKRGRLDADLHISAQNDDLNPAWELHFDYFRMQSIRANDNFIPVAQFFSSYRPIKQPFALLSGTDDGDLQLDLIREAALPHINSALCREVAFQLDIAGGWGSFLYGDSLWEIGFDEARRLGRQLGLSQEIEDITLFIRSKSRPADAALVRTAIPERVRIFVWRRDNARCVECGSKEKLEFDHIIPVSRGGSSTERNIQLLCEPCNRKKSNRI